MFKSLQLTIKPIHLALALTLGLSACANNQVAEYAVAEKVSENKEDIAAKIAWIKENSWLSGFDGAFDILTTEQILEHGKSIKDYTAKTYLNLTDEQIAQFEAMDLSFLYFESNEHEAVYTKEQIEEMKRGNSVDLTQEQEAKFEELRLKAEKAMADKFVQIGTTVPDFELPDASGKKRKLSDFRGKYVLIDFWGTWCQPCVEKLPSLAEYYKIVDKSKVEFIGVCTNCEDYEEFLEENPLEWVQLIDPAEDQDDSVAGLYGVSYFPTLLLIDPNGKVLDASYFNDDAIGKETLKTIQKYVK